MGTLAKPKIIEFNSYIRDVLSACYWGAQICFTCIPSYLFDYADSESGLKTLLAIPVRALEFTLNTNKLRATRFDINAWWEYMGIKRSDLQFSFI